MKTDIFKKIIKEAVKEAIREEMKDILLEAIKGNKQPINESKTLNFTTNSIPHQPVKSPIDSKKAYMDILGEMSQGPKSSFDGEFKVQSNVDPINGTLPEGQLGLDQIMGLMKGK